MRLQCELGVNQNLPRMDLQVELQVNYYSLLLLFAVSLTVHLVINRLTVICQTVRYLLL